MNGSHDARILCERAAFELSRERFVRIGRGRAAFDVATAEAFVATAATAGVLRPTRLVLASGRAKRLGGLGDGAVVLPIGGLKPAEVAALSGASELEPDIRAASQPFEPADAIHSALLDLARMAGRLPAVVAAPARSGRQPHALHLSAASLLAGVAADACSAKPKRLLSVRLPLRFCEETRLHVWRDANGHEYHALEIGKRAGRPPVVRLHSECMTGDLLGSLRCDCEIQLTGAIERIAREGHGFLIYLPQEGRGVGLTNKLRAYRLQERGVDTYTANSALGLGEDERNFDAAGSMLADLGVEEIYLLSNNPEKARQLNLNGVKVCRILPHVFDPNPHNESYIAAKRMWEQARRADPHRMDHSALQVA